MSSPARILFGAVFLVFSSINAATIAQVSLPSGWQVQGKANGTIIYTYGTGIERVVRASFTPEPGVNLDQSIEGARGAFRAYAPCLGIDNAAIRSILAAKGRQISWEDTQNRCIIIVVAQKPNADLIIGWEPKTSTAKTRQLALSLATGNISTTSSSKPSGAASKNSTTPTSRPLNQPTQGISKNNSELAKALAQVPVANRPVAIILRGEVRPTAGSSVATIEFEPWMLFPNGLAVDCYDWDPAILVPTRESLGRAKPNCDFLRWQKVGSKYQIQDNDGTWGELQDASEFQPLKAGQRWAFLFNAESLFVTSGGPSNVITPLIKKGLITNKWVRFIPNGIVQFDKKKLNYGGDSTYSVAASVQADYYLDGYLMALRMADGQVSRHFIITLFGKGVPEFFYIDGNRYQRVDEK